MAGFKPSSLQAGSVKVTLDFSLIVKSHNVPISTIALYSIYFKSHESFGSEKRNLQISQPFYGMVTWWEPSTSTISKDINVCRVNMVCYIYK